MRRLAPFAVLVALAAGSLVGCAAPPPRQYAAYVSSLLTSDVEWTLLVDGEVTDRGTIRVRSNLDQPFNLPLEEGQRVSFTVAVVGSGLARCRVVRVADGAEVVPLLRQAPQVDRAPGKSPPVSCEFAA